MENLETGGVGHVEIEGTIRATTLPWASGMSICYDDDDDDDAIQIQLGQLKNTITNTPIISWVWQPGAATVLLPHEEDFLANRVADLVKIDFRFTNQRSGQNLTLD